MLGENHSLLNEFPQQEETINQLIQADEAFAKDTKTYNELDEEIRNLELSNSPIDDEAMHQLKHDRSVLKDSLFQRIQTA
ncbi:YdcH family protein [Vibrio maerlii]|uniref:YdcH family protein n=1 Tax=Vibrio maerlii TaxID=2231648 RepID=UPI000E3EBE6F|nr:YdcH family protein [Vibrio maerlii]